MRTPVTHRCGLLLAALMLAACSTQPTRSSVDVNDPWEEHNRRTHALNRTLDMNIVRPAAQGYVRITPSPVRKGLGNFFSNLGQPISAVNKLLQGKPGLAGSGMARFFVNVIAGAGGLLDPASKLDIVRVDADFGQTLAGWGWKESRYMELPLVGPTTVRDSIGLVGDTLFSPLWWLQNRTGSYAPWVVAGLDLRAQFIGPDRALIDAMDSYALQRDVFLQQRARAISGKEEAELPDYDLMLDDY